MTRYASLPRLAVLAAAALVAAACGDTTAPPTATTIVFSTSSVSLDAIGATQTVTATVKDQHGNPMPTAIVTWSSASSAAGVVPDARASGTATIVASANGSGTITATSGKAQATLSVTVTQAAALMQKLAGDNQIGSVSKPLTQVIAVRVLDRLGTPVAGQTVTFTVATGGGSVTGATQTTDVTGVAALGSWTLGATEGANSLLAATTAAGVAPLTFTATATKGPIAVSVAANAGGNEAVMAGQPVPTLPSVVVRDAAGAPVAGFTVNFAVTAGGGTITGANAVSDASGVARLGSWTTGTPAGVNVVSATAPGVGGPAVTFTVSGCEGGGGAGYAITICYKTPMTATQRQAFVNAAARWGSLITADQPDVAVDIPANACGTSPSVNMTVDDLLIFAAIDPIDGPGAVLGSSGPCFLRNSDSLSVVGTMHFDSADMAALESSGQLPSVILHEMGHVLGIGSLWSFKGFLQNPSSAADTLDTFFSGAAAITGFNNIGGSTYTGGQKVPVENTNGPGTINVHWRESVLRNELMTGFLNAGNNPLSELTVRSLQDLGYTVNAAAADPFSLTLSLQANPFGSALSGGISLANDAYTGPVWTIDHRGVRQRRIR